MTKYVGDWYGNEEIWEDYEYIKTVDDPSFWKDKQIRVKVINDHRSNGGFVLEWALSEGIIKKLEE